jgi:anti-sigma regulatory factor (Ser/Thr protein kinase)
MIVEVADSSQVFSVRRAATGMAKDGGFDEERAGRVALIATEMASNLLKHATRGFVVLRRYADVSGSGVELLALDRGNGIHNVPSALRDGYSTAGSFGAGLGVMQRQADGFEIYSRADKGTAVVARVAADPPTLVGKALLGVIVEPYPGETVCGDAWAYADSPQGPTLIVVDGTGHGPFAEIAAQTALRSFLQNASESCTRILELIHAALQPTRGAAVSIARIDAAQQVVRFAGIGNVSGLLQSTDGTKRMVSHSGTAGHIARRIREFVYPYVGSPTVVLHSDGMSGRWGLEDYPGLGVSHPSIIAGVLYRDFCRGTDDCAVVVMRT